MTGLEALEDVIRQRLMGAYLYGALAAMLEWDKSRGVPLRYPEEDADTAAVLAAAREAARS